MTHFQFLEAEWSDVFESAGKAEAVAFVDPRTACFYARRALELAVNWAYKFDRALKLPYQDHADFLRERFDLNYPHYKGEFARVITFKTEYAHLLLDLITSALIILIGSLQHLCLGTQFLGSFVGPHCLSTTPIVILS